MQKYRTEQSEKLYEQAIKLLPGGASSGARIFIRGHIPYPIFIERGEGSKVYDVDGNEYIDYLLALGPLILGHSDPRIIGFAIEEMKKGTMYGLPLEIERKVAEKVIQNVPSIEKVQFTNSGSEGVHMALRLARAKTGKEKVIKFEGHYHGWMDNICISFTPSLDIVGSSLNPHKIRVFGAPKSVLKDVIVLPWNDKDVLKKAIEKHKHEIAAIITEPYMANGGVIPPGDGYLEAMRELTEKNNIVLIFDEVITGFRLALGGAQQFFNIKPDLTVLSKALGAGFPIGAYGGRADIMDLISQNKVMHAGTFSANRVSLAAAYKTLECLEENDGEIYKKIYKIGNKLINGIKNIIMELNIKAIIQGVGPMFQIYFTELKEIKNYRNVCLSNENIFIEFRERLLENGIIIRPRYFGEFYISAAHTEYDINQTLTVVNQVLKNMKKEGIV